MTEDTRRRRGRIAAIAVALLGAILVCLAYPVLIEPHMYRLEHDPGFSTHGTGQFLKIVVEEHVITGHARGRVQTDTGELLLTFKGRAERTVSETRVEDGQQVWILAIRSRNGSAYGWQREGNGWKSLTAEQIDQELRYGEPETSRAMVGKPSHGPGSP